MEKVKAYVKDWKKEKVDELSKLIKQYSVIGLIDLRELPSSQLQVIRGNLRKDLKILTTKKSFLTRAFEKINHEDLIEKVKGPTGVILTKLNPFKLFQLIKKNKSLSAIKPGQIAPFDLIIPKGDTPFAPGPIIGELGSIGVKAKIMAGKISVLKDAIVVPKGEPAGDLAATILNKLGIKPIEVGLQIIALKEDGTIYTPSMLDIKIEKLIATGFNYAKNLVLNTGLIMPEFIKEVLQKAQMQALTLNGVVHPDQAIKAAPAQTGEKKEETKEEEEEEEEVSEEEAAAGLGTLFG